MTHKSWSTALPGPLFRRIVGLLQPVEWGRARTSCKLWLAVELPDAVWKGAFCHIYDEGDAADVRYRGLTWQQRLQRRLNSEHAMCFGRARINLLYAHELRADHARFCPDAQALYTPDFALDALSGEPLGDFVPKSLRRQGVREVRALTRLGTGRSDSSRVVMGYGLSYGNHWGKLFLWDEKMATMGLQVVGLSFSDPAGRHLWDACLRCDRLAYWHPERRKLELLRLSDASNLHKGVEIDDVLHIDCRAGVVVCDLKRPAGYRLCGLHGEILHEWHGATVQPDAWSQRISRSFCWASQLQPAPPAQQPPSQQQERKQQQELKQDRSSARASKSTSASTDRVPVIVELRQWRKTAWAAALRDAGDAKAAAAAAAAMRRDDDRRSYSSDDEPEEETTPVSEEASPFRVRAVWTLPLSVSGSEQQPQLALACTDRFVVACLAVHPKSVFLLHVPSGIERELPLLEEARARLLVHAAFVDREGVLLSASDDGDGEPYVVRVDFGLPPADMGARSWPSGAAAEVAPAIAAAAAKAAKAVGAKTAAGVPSDAAVGEAVDKPAPTMCVAPPAVVAAAARGDGARSAAVAAAGVSSSGAAAAKAAARAKPSRVCLVS